MQHLLNGHSYARCIRSYTLTAAALVNALKDHNSILKDCVSSLETYHSRRTKQENALEDIITEPNVIDLCSKIENCLKTTETSSRTA